jgi:hypothetical protein
MARLTGGSFKRISPEDIKTRRSSLNQLIDVIQEDVSGSSTRRSYQVFVTGGVGTGVTSSLYQTIYDQDFTLQTANPIFDMTVGLFHVTGTAGTTVEDARTSTSGGKLLFASESLMMREKIDVYKQFAATLLGDSDQSFFAPFGSNTTSTTDRNANDRIEEALFLSFKRLFARDQIKRETFAIKLYRSAALDGSKDGATAPTEEYAFVNGYTGSNLQVTSTSGSAIFTDIGAASNIRRTFGGSVGNIVNSSNTSETVGLIFYDHGTVVLDMSKAFFADQHLSGTMAAMEDSSRIIHDRRDGNGSTNVFSHTSPSGETVFGGRNVASVSGSLIPEFVVSASIDDIVDHIAETRFSSGTFTAMTFQNVTNINSTLIFCRATADEFNYSTNPTFTNSSNRIRVIDTGQEDTQRTFTFPTTVGLHDEFGNLLAVAKMSRPIEKNDEKDITFRVRLDF